MPCLQGAKSSHAILVRKPLDPMTQRALNALASWEQQERARQARGGRARWDP